MVHILLNQRVTLEITKSLYLEARLHAFYSTGYQIEEFMQIHAGILVQEYIIAVAIRSYRNLL